MTTHAMNRGNTMRRLASLAIFATVAISSASFSFADGEKVKIADLNWTGPQAVAHILEVVIKGPLGSEAEIVKGLSDQSVIAAGMDKGDGTVDVWTELWLPNQQALWDKYIEGTKTIVHNDNPYKGVEGIFVPSYMADKVKSVEDLKKPEVAALFDAEGTGKGQYFPGDAAWKSSKVWQVKFKDYGLSDLWAPKLVSDDVFKSQLKAAYADKKPILFYYWTPEWLFAAYDLTRVEEPAYSEGCIDLKLDEEDWLNASKFSCASPDASVYVAYAKSLETRNPAVACFLKQIRFEPAMMSDWILKIGRDQVDPHEFAETWVKDNPDKVNEWIKGCKA